MTVPGSFTFQDLMANLGDFLSIPLVRDGLIGVLAFLFLGFVIRQLSRVVFRA